MAGRKVWLWFFWHRLPPCCTGKIWMKEQKSGACVCVCVWGWICLPRARSFTLSLLIFVADSTFPQRGNQFRRRLNVLPSLHAHKKTQTNVHARAHGHARLSVGTDVWFSALAVSLRMLTESVTYSRRLGFQHERQQNHVVNQGYINGWLHVSRTSASCVT